MEGFHKLDDDLLKVIEKEESTSSVSSDDKEKIKQNHREFLKHLLHTNKFQIGVVILVIFDCIIVITELMIDLRAFELHEESVVPHIFHYISIAVLSIFLVEIVVKVYAFRLDFFRHKLEVFDALVVIVSFALDLAFSSGEGLVNGIGLIIILRLWRVARILNGIILSVKIQAEKRLNRERKTREAVEKELTKFRDYCTAQEAELEMLQNLLRKHGIDFEFNDRPLVPVTQIAVVAEVNQCEPMHIMIKD